MHEPVGFFPIRSRFLEDLAAIPERDRCLSFGILRSFMPANWLGTRQARVDWPPVSPGPIPGNVADFGSPTIRLEEIVAPLHPRIGGKIPLTNKWDTGF